MFLNSLTLETCLQQTLDIHPPWSVQKAELERPKKRLRIDLYHAESLVCVRLPLLTSTGTISPCPVQYKNSISARP